jgi:hypothetical protein
MHRSLVVPALAAALAAASGTACSSTATSPEPLTSGGPSSGACNGHSELCSRPYDQVVFAGTHNAYSVVEEAFGAPNQTHAVARQLADGVRVLHFEVHWYKEQALLCHGVCAIGSKPLVDDLTAVASFLAAHPDEVVTFLLERSDAFITADQIGAAFDEAGLTTSVHRHAAGEAWPTLGEMLAKREQVVAFLDDTSGSSYPWLLPRWTWTWETPWDNQTPADFGRCGADRGAQGNDLYVVDTYLEDEVIPSAARAALVNEDPFLIDRLLSCKQKTGALPNFAMVNFYEVGDVFHAVDVLNGFAPAPDHDLASFPPSSWPDAGDAGAASDGGGT